MEHNQQHATHRWEHYNGHIPQNAVYAGNEYVVIRATHEGQVVVGKLDTHSKKAYIPYGGEEKHVEHHVEVLVHAPGADIHWVPASHGQIPEGAVGPIGKEALFVGRALCPHPENKHTPGKIHVGHKCLYMPWGGKEQKYDQYEVLVIKSAGPPYQWVAWTGSAPHNAVKAGDAYLVARAHHEGDVIPGKLSTHDGKAYVPWGDREHHATSHVEILTLNHGAEAVWVAASHGQVPQGAVGPIGKDGTFVGRVLCPHPENKHTPGKIHPHNKCFYLPWDGKETRYDNYEALVIQAARHH